MNNPTFLLNSFKHVITLIFIYSIPVYAIDITIIDQHNNPLKGAVVILPDIEFSARQQPVSVDQVARQFVPKVTAIPVGQQVIFPNSDNVRHHVYSFSKPNPFEISLYAGREAEPIAFRRAGVVVLGCNIHDDMVGYIFVGKHWAAASDANGVVTLPTTDYQQKIGLWHPRQQDELESVYYQTLYLSKENKPQKVFSLTVIEEKKTKKKATFKSRFSDSK